MNEKDFLKEKELLLDSIENNTSEHWQNYYKDVPIECIYDDLVIDINEIKNLQSQLEQKEKQLNDIKEYVESSSLEVNTRDYGMITVCNSDDILSIIERNNSNE